ncbi:uncharacterized protein ACIBXB_016985 isoform 1-T5 [Morphnus guianensis]
MEPGCENTDDLCPAKFLTSEVAHVMWRHRTTASLTVCVCACVRASQRPARSTRPSAPGRSRLCSVPCLKPFLGVVREHPNSTGPQPYVQLTGLLPRSIFVVWISFPAPKQQRFFLVKNTTHKTRQLPGN